MEGLESLLSRGFDTIFLKPVYGFGGSGILKLEIRSGKFYHLGSEVNEDQLKKMLPEQLYVVQQEVKQHPDIAEFCSASVNTLRVITMMKNGTPVHLVSFMRIGSGDGYVDNWDSGSLAVGVDEKSGRLKEKGTSKPKRYFYKNFLEHPQSKLVFKGFKVPYYHEAVEIALRIHKFTYGLFLLAFDFAITENGPVVIEVNEKPGYVTVQIVSGGLRERLYQI